MNNSRRMQFRITDDTMAALRLARAVRNETLKKGEKGTFSELLKDLANLFTLKKTKRVKPLGDDKTFYITDKVFDKIESLAESLNIEPFQVLDKMFDKKAITLLSEMTGQGVKK